MKLNPAVKDLFAQYPFRAAGARLAEVRVTILPAPMAPVASPLHDPPGGPEPF